MKYGNLKAKTMTKTEKKIAAYMALIGKGFIIYTYCCMGETLAVLIAYNLFI